MLGSQTVLIVDESGYAALDLADAIEESDGCVVGPVATAAEALTILDSVEVCGAIVDCELAAAFEVVMLLAQRKIPIVVQVSGSPPHSLGDLNERASVLVRPVDPRTILETLLMEIGKSEMRGSNTLASDPKRV
ncbi:MAG TPA: hypothetical protein VHS33_04225 [Sphingomicrobium sp.]|jgi:hypothetical protein|nr:hypothetical protein [Sphingomicrobium sp.]